MKRITLYLLAVLACLSLNAVNPRTQVIGNFSRSASNHYAYPYGTGVELP